MRGIWSSFFTVIVVRTAAFSCTFSLEDAAASEIPGFIRAITSTHHMLSLDKREPAESFRSCGATIGCMLKGKKISGVPCAEYAPVNPDGFTPTIVIGVAFTRMVFPMTCGERPNRL